MLFPLSDLSRSPLPRWFTRSVDAPAPVFSRRTRPQVQRLIIGILLAPGKRAVTAALSVLGLAEDPHFGTYHRILNHMTAGTSAARFGHGIRRNVFSISMPASPLSTTWLAPRSTHATNKRPSSPGKRRCGGQLEVQAGCIPLQPLCFLDAYRLPYRARRKGTSVRFSHPQDGVRLND